MANVAGLHSNRIVLYTIFVWAISLLFLACNNESGELKKYEEEGRILAITYCSSCHVLPDPALLDKRTWNNGVLPNMGRRLGIKGTSLFDYPPISAALEPAESIISDKDWDKILYYYIHNAKQTIPSDRKLRDQNNLGQFKVGSLEETKNLTSIITYLFFDEKERCFWVGDGVYNDLFQFNSEGHLLKTFKQTSPVVNVIHSNEMMVTNIGIMRPNDEANGTIAIQATTGISDDTIASGLTRPVYSQLLDITGNGNEDIVVCEYGNNIGKLSWFENLGNEKYDKHILSNTPGAIHIESYDFNQDGLQDIIALFAQGDERMVIYTNMGGGLFQEKTVLRFPPVYGSYFFELKDFDGDGKMDIIYTNGDNADFSAGLKDFHGVRIFIDIGDMTYEEKYFFPLHGAARTKTLDFDQDGDLDIIATAVFTDTISSPENSLVYLLNKGEGMKFDAYSFIETSYFPWDLIDAKDIDGDGDTDVIIGAMDHTRYRSFMSDPEYLPKSDRKPSVTILLNQLF